MFVINILQAIKERRSTHSFYEKEVDVTILKEILTYGTWAPTHYMKESWNIKMYQGNGKTAFVNAIIASYQRIGMLKQDNDPKTEKMIVSMKQFLLGIPHHAVIYFAIDQDPIRYEEEYSSVCAFIQNVQLAAWSFGVGMLWTITPYMHDPGFARDIGLSSDQIKIAAVMQIGYPKKVSRNKGRTAIEEKLEIITE
ncbi:nitroreductase family protein [Lentibacillus sp. N15]|uniref:nitroreductase family protein n=1 Tax=Lentibacillus songyuanensis TaxID=3136161 RepID=UPI0031BB7B87